MRRVLAAAAALIVMAGIAPAPAGATAWRAAPAAGCPAPLPGPRAVVQLAYLVVLHRCPDPGGAATWELALRDGMSAGAFARRVAATPEARRAVVADAYAAVLARPATAEEQAFWAGWLRPAPGRARRHDHLVAELLASAEVRAATGGDDGRFVDVVYGRVLGRPAAADERAYWVGRLRATGDRRAVARTLLRLPEPLGATVGAAWREVLDADPTPAQRAWEAARLRADGDRLALSARLVGSAAFATRAAGRALVVPGRYVALGDSYVVGEGNGDDVSPPGAGCSYTASAYPEVARTRSEVVPGHLEVAACSGATLSSLYPWTDPGGGAGAAGQIDRIAAGGAPSLVTLTIGGNDIGFVSLVSTCLQVWAGGAQANPGYSASACDRLLQVEAPAGIARLRTGTRGCGGTCSIPRAVADVVAAAPGAHVLVVGYPPLVPARDAGCRGPVTLDGEAMAGVEWRIAPSHVRRSRAVVADLNAVLRDAAVAAGATYVDPSAAFAGHEVCSADPWIHGLALGPGASPETSSFHPNRRGGTGLATALVAGLGG